MSFFRGPAGLCGLLLASSAIRGVSATSSVEMAYCASINTASTSGNSSIYQSDGLCYNFCVDDYAYAIVQEYECWCSDYTPDSDDQVDTSECENACPGYPSDYCGGDDLYGYMSLSKSPSGTKSASTASSTSSSSSSKTTSSTISTTESTTSSTTTTTSSSSTSSSTSSHSSTSSSSDSSSDSSSSSTSVTVSTVTTGGVVQTVTVIPTPLASSTSSSSSEHKGLSTGAAVGIAIGVVVAVVVAAGAAFFVWRRKRQQQTEKDESLFNPPSTRGTSPGTLNGLNIGEAAGAGSFGRRGADGSWESDQSGRRRSTLMPIDPRIDPGFSDIYSRSENKSRDSINSLRDDHDYSRRVHQPTKILRATNPDPDDE